MQPRWLIDYASLYRHPNPALVALHLSACIARPGWDRDRLCSACENWKPTREIDEDAITPLTPFAQDVPFGEDNIPRRPGAIDARTNCAGCWYAHVEPNPLWKRPARTQRKTFVPLPVVETALVEVEPGKSLTIEWTEIDDSGRSLYADRTPPALPADKHDDPADRVGSPRFLISWL